MFLKIVLLGVARVGKSSLLSRFCSSRSFESGYIETTSPDFNGARVRLQSGQEAVVQIWDLPGNTAHHALMAQTPAAYMRDAHVCVLVCDLCVKESFVALEKLRAEFIAANADQQSSIAFVLLINKAEPTHARKQAVFASDVLAWCARHNIRHFYETSALSDTNVLIALVNMTQLAADMDLVRRGVKIACDAKELARQEEEQAREKAAARARAEEARLKAERQAQEEADAAARAEQERVEAEAKRAADFEARWTAQRLEAEEAAAAAAAEKAAAAARARERAEKRKASIAQSAYGPFKQRSHRLSAALIQQHAQAAGADPASLGLSPSLSPSPGPDEDKLPASPHKAGAVPASLRAPHPRPTQSRPSNLGVGTGAMLRQTMQQLDAVTERAPGSTTPGSAKGGRSSSGTGPHTGRRRAGSLSQPSGHHPGTSSLPAHARSESQQERGAAAAAILERGAVLRPHAPSTPPHGSHGSRPTKRAHVRAQSFGPGIDEHERQQPQSDEVSPTAAAESEPAMVPAVDSSADSNETDLDEAAAEAASADLSAASPLDPVTEALLDVVSAQVPHWSRSDLIRLHAPFEPYPAGMPWGSFRVLWKRLAARVPAWLLFAERFFAAMDQGQTGRVEFESLALALDALCAPGVDARAKLLFRVFDFRNAPFLEQPVHDEDEDGTDKPGTAAKAGEAEAADPTAAAAAAAAATSPPLTKKSFLHAQRRELQGMERFAYCMYDADTDVPAPAAAPTATAGEQPLAGSRLSDRFITRDCLAKVCAILLQSLPAFQAALHQQPRAQLQQSRVAAAAAGGIDARRLELAARLQPVVTQMVDEWFASAGYPTSFTLSELQWREAVQRQPHIIQPFAPPLPTTISQSQPQTKQAEAPTSAAAEAPSEIHVDASAE